MNLICEQILTSSLFAICLLLNVLGSISCSGISIGYSLSGVGTYGMNIDKCSDFHS